MRSATLLVIFASHFTTLVSSAMPLRALDILFLALPRSSVLTDGDIRCRFVAKLSITPLASMPFLTRALILSTPTPIASASAFFACGMDLRKELVKFLVLIVPVFIIFCSDAMTVAEASSSSL